MARTDEVIRFQRIYSWSSAFDSLAAAYNVREILEWMRWNGYARDMDAREERAAFDPTDGVSYVAGRN